MSIIFFVLIVVTRTFVELYMGFLALYVVGHMLLLWHILPADHFVSKVSVETLKKIVWPLTGVIQKNLPDSWGVVLSGCVVGFILGYFHRLLSIALEFVRAI